MNTRSKFKLPKLYAREGRPQGRRGGAQRQPSGGRRGRSRRASEYGIQLREKQKVRFAYGLRERPLRNYVTSAVSRRGASDASSNLYRALESRLDSMVYRLGFAPTRAAARQLVTHGHITVNGRRVDVPSYAVRAGSTVAIRMGSRDRAVFQDLDSTLKKYTPPAWLDLNGQERSALVTAAPALDEPGVKSSLDTIIEYYSR